MRNRAAFAACLVMVASSVAVADSAVPARSSTTSRVCTAEKPWSGTVGSDLGAGCTRARVAEPAVCIARPVQPSLE